MKRAAWVCVVVWQMGCSGPVQEPLPDASLPDAAVDGGSADGGADDGGADASVAAPILTATVTLEDVVELEWRLAPGELPSTLELLRDGVQLTALSADASTWSDSSLSGGALGEPSDLTAVATTGGITLSWDAAVARPGPAATYQVVATYGGAELRSNEAVGRRAAASVTYELERDGGIPWSALLSGTFLIDTSAPDTPVLVIDGGVDVVVDDARTTAILALDGGYGLVGAQVAYRVRALGGGAVSPWAPSITAAREPWQYVLLQWQRSLADADQDYVDLPRVIGTRWFDSSPALDQGRWYRLVFRAAGMPEVVLAGRRALVYSVRAVSVGWGVAFIRSDGVLEERDFGGPGFQPSLLRVLDSGPFVEVARTDWATCAIRPDRSLWCGPDFTPAGAFDAIRRDNPTGGGLFCGLRDGGFPVCWGGQGELTLPGSWSSSPVSTVATNNACGPCVVRLDGTLECTTLVACGGDGGADVASAERFATFSPRGPLYVCGLLVDGGAFCDGVAVPPSDGGIAEVVTGGPVYATGVCLRRNDGRMWCAGRGASGVFPFFSAERFGSFSISEYQGCGVTTDGRMTCFGSQPAGLDINPIALPLAKPVRRVAPAGEFAMALLTTGELEGWGRYMWIDATSVPPVGRYIDLAMASPESACAVHESGAIHCWGFIPATPPVVGAFTAIIRAGGGYCALTASRQAVCFGGPPSPPGEFVQLSSNGSHTCGVLVDGGLACDDNSVLAGLPGTGPWSRIQMSRETCALSAAGRMTCTRTRAPMSDVAGFSIGDRQGQFCAVFTDGGVHCEWVMPPTPGWRPVPRLPFKSVEASVDSEEVCGIRADDVMMCWGPIGWGEGTVAL